MVSDGGMWYHMERTQETYRLSDQLIRAIGKGKLHDREEDINSLIDKGADINRRHGTLLPLQYACCLGDWHVLELLIQRGAKVNEPDGYDRTALHYAAEQDERCVRILLENGALVDKGDGNGDTALHWAAYKNNTLCVQRLLQHGANVNAVDLNNDTPVSWAARKGNLDVIQVLLNYNADVDIRNIHGQTALKKSAAVQVLLNYNADVDIRNVHGQTALKKSAAAQASGLNNEEDDACLELLVKASGQFDLTNLKGELLPVMARDNRLNEILHPLVNSPRSLLEQCRRRIRHSIGRKYLPDVVPNLPLPRKLQEFILLKNTNSAVLLFTQLETKD